MNNTGSKLACSIVTLVGVIFFTIGSWLSVSSIQFKQEAVKIDAMVTNIDTYTTGTGDDKSTHHNVYVEYDFEGTPYSAMLNSYSSSMKVGKTTEVYVKADNPSNPRSIGTELFLGVLFTIIGGIATIIGIILIIKLLKTIKQNKEVIQNGRQITATVETYEYDETTTINGRHPIIYICSYNGMRFESSSIFTKQPLLDIGDTVTVFVDYNDISKYFVDVQHKYS